MAINKEAFLHLKEALTAKGVTLVAVSKTKPVADIQALYDLGQRHFGENYVQELVDKHKQLPTDICWHFIGHLQSNKTKYIVPFVHLIHGIDSIKLLKEVNKSAQKISRVVPVLLQLHVAQEETKFGFDDAELKQLFNDQTALNSLQNIRIDGMMGMASFVSDEAVIESEFRQLKNLYDQCDGVVNNHFHTLSMGMSNDYKIAISNGSNMVRIGSLLFGAR